MADKPFVEKKCTCGKFSWDSEFGSYNERHDNPKTGKSEPCNTNGGTYVDGVKQ